MLLALLGFYDPQDAPRILHETRRERNGDVFWRSLIQCKCGSARLSAVEREGLMLLPRPPQAVVEVWTYRDRCREPLIERL